MIKIIVGVVIVVLIVVAIAYSDYIAWFFRLLKHRINHDSQINKLVNKNKIRRLVSNKSIRELVVKVDEKIKLLKHPVSQKPYVVSEALERKLRYSRYDDKSVQELFSDICKYMSVDETEVDFSIRRSSSRTQSNAAGLYNEKEDSIVIEISTYTTTDQIISTMAHELSHHIMLSKGIELKDRKSNEIFTDLTAVYMGFYKYFYKSYKERSRLIYDGEFTILVDRKKLGYISYRDVKYAQKFIKKIKRRA